MVFLWFFPHPPLMSPTRYACHAAGGQPQCRGPTAKHGGTPGFWFAKMLQKGLE